jgi:hypothetical protein
MHVIELSPDKPIRVGELAVRQAPPLGGRRERLGHSVRGAMREGLLDRITQFVFVHGPRLARMARSGRSRTREFGVGRGTLYACSFSAMWVVRGQTENAGVSRPMNDRSHRPHWRSGAQSIGSSFSCFWCSSALSCSWWRGLRNAGPCEFNASSKLRGHRRVRPRSANPQRCQGFSLSISEAISTTARQVAVAARGPPTPSTIAAAVSGKR